MTTQEMHYILSDNLEISESVNQRIEQTLFQIRTNAEKVTRKNDRPRMRPLFRKPAVFAATIAIFILMFGTAALATNLFGMRDMLLQSNADTGTYLVDNEGNEIINSGLPWEDFVAANPDATEVEFELYYVTVSGLPGSPEFEAAQMWWRMHMEEYEGHKLSPEEIAVEHGLIFQGEDNIINYYEIDPDNFEPFLHRIAYGSFLDESLIVYPGYVYDLGTFRFDGYYGDSGFSIRSTRKGTFDLVYGIVSDISAYEQWPYVNTYGTKILLLQDEISSVIIVDTDEAFIMITVNGGSEISQTYNIKGFREAYDLYEATGDETYLDNFGPEMIDLLITRSDLEQLADMIDFSRLK
ncbi:MAG: anti-sigma factor [Oscillospiraceae bacterium]|jgi:hypothetical protein|nr:anti-sigma factor [Oscillospiraceae bacterium]